MAQQDKQSSSADALAALASGGVPPLVAQDAAMLGIQPPSSPPPQTAAAPGAAAADPFAALAAVAKPTAQAPPPPVPAIPNFAVAPPMSPEVRRARSVQAQKRAAQHHGHAFRQVAIPLLLSVGTILFLMATIVLVKLPKNIPEGEVNPGLMHSPWAPWLVLAAYLVGAVLFLGAFLFHAEVKQANLKMKRTQTRNGQDVDNQ